MSAFEIVFKPTAVKDVKKLPMTIRKQIGFKLDYYIQQSNPLAYASRLIEPSRGGDYRFRIGNYRVVFDIDRNGSKLIVLYVEHRREVYRRR